MDVEPASNRRARILVAGLVVGLFLVLGGLVWSTLAAPSSVWSREQAAEYQAAGEALHAARSQSPASDGTAKSALTTAQQRFDRIEAELVAAQTGRQRISRWLVRLGLAAMLLFGVGYLASRGE
jgi:hypothetical protein